MSPGQMVPVALAVALLCSRVDAQHRDEFRVETDVFVEDSKKPDIETLTLFVGDMVYDFLLSEPEEVILFDFRRNRIVLLDIPRRVQTALTTGKLVRFAAAIKSSSAKSDKKEFFYPQFTEEFDEQTGELVLRGVRLSYRCQGGAAKHDGAVRRYRKFADWSARLNAARGNLPPFARVELNQALAEKSLLPETVRRTVVIPRPLKDEKHEVRSHHTYLWNLSNTDRKRIEDVASYQASFKKVTLAQYLGVDELAAHKD